MTARICTIGSMTFDLFLKPHDLTVMRFCRAEKYNEEYLAIPYGGKVKIEDVYERHGGGGQNTAVGLTRLGIAATPIGSIGADPWGKNILQNLKREGIAAKYVREGKLSTGFSVILNSFEGERSVLAFSGANEALQNFDRTILDDCDGVFFNHISISGNGAESIFEKIKRHFLKHPQKFIAWNPGKEQLSQGAMAFADFFPVIDLLILNKEEAELFTGRTVKKQKKNRNFSSETGDYREIFQVFIRQGVRAIAITDGLRGSQICDGRKIHFCGVLEDSPRVDTLGAGDAFGSALFYALFHQKELPFALKCATINAASVVAQIGAEPGLLSEKELLSRVAKTTVRQEEMPF